MTWRKIRRWLAVAFIIGLVAFYFVVRHVGDTLLAATNHPISAPPAELPVVATKIASESGSNLGNWCIPAENSHATVVLVHGIRATRTSLLDRARLFHDAGYAVVMIDLQAHGESPGEHVTVGYLERFDVRAAVQFAHEQNPSHRVAVVGVSLGGAAALLATPLKIDALVLESVFPTISEAVHNRIALRLGPLSYIISPILIGEMDLRSGISSSELCPIDHIAKIGCPVLIASGDADVQTTIAETQRLFDAAHEPKQLSVFKGAGHVNLLGYNSEQYKHDVLPFLNKYVAQSKKCCAHQTS